MNPIQYFKEVILELKKVSWPSKKQTIDKTIVVIIVCIIVGLYIGSLDTLFQQLIKLIINQ